MISKAIATIALIIKVKLSCCYSKIVEKVFYLTLIFGNFGKQVSKQITLIQSYCNIEKYHYLLLKPMPQVILYRLILLIKYINN